MESLDILRFCLAILNKELRMRFKHLQTKHVDCHFIPEGMIFLSELLIGEMTVADEVDSPLRQAMKSHITESLADALPA
jgi:hypothetical protein